MMEKHVYTLQKQRRKNENITHVFAKCLVKISTIEIGSSSKLSFELKQRFVRTQLFQSTL